MSIFCSEWKSEKIGDILKERKEIGFSNLPLLSVTAEKGVVKRNEIDIKDNSSADKSNYKRICPFDIGYNTMRMWQGRSGVSEYEGIVSPAYTVLKPTSKVDSNFIGYLFKLPAMINIFRRYSQGLVNDTLSLKYNQLKNITIKIPSFREQKKIARILNVWDEAIALKKDLIELKKEQKKGLMQKLLTGSIRVPGIWENWKEERLSELAEIVMGHSPKSTYYNTNGEGVFLIQGMADCKGRKTKPKIWTKQTTKMCKVNDIIMTVRAPVGKISMAIHEACIGRGVCAIRPKKSYEFLYHKLVFLEEKWEKISQGSTFESVNSKEIKDLKIKVPISEEEQKTIAKILSKADKEIELLEKENEYLKEQKKGLMQLLLTGKVRVKC